MILPYCDLVQPVDYSPDTPLFMIYSPPEVITCMRKKTFDIPRRIVAAFIRYFLTGESNECCRLMFGELSIEIPERLISTELMQLKRKSEDHYCKLVDWKIKTAQILFDGDPNESLQVYKTLSPDICLDQDDIETLTRMAYKYSLNLVFLDRAPGLVYMIFNRLLANIIQSDTINETNWHRILKQEYKKRMMHDGN